MNKYEQVALGSLVSEYSERNRMLTCNDVYSVTNSEGFVPSTEYFSKEVFSKNISTYKAVHRGMFAYNPSRVNVGSLAWLKDKDTIVVSPLYVVFKIDETKLRQQFLKYYLHSDMGITQIRNLTSGSVRDSLKFSALERIIIPLPEVDKQECIIAALDCITMVMRKRQDQIAVLEKLELDTFIDMFGDPLINLKGWAKYPLNEKCEIITGNTPPRSNPGYYGTYIEWIKSDNINTNNTFLTKAVEYLSEDGAKRGRIVRGGSVLMTCIAGSLSCIGNVAIADRQVAFNQQINAIVPGDDVDVFFLYFMLRLTKPYIQSDVNMSLKGIVNKGKLSSMSFIFPPIDEQVAFSNIVQRIETQKARLQASLVELETIYKSTLQMAFNGELFQ